MLVMPLAFLVHGTVLGSAFPVPVRRSVCR